MDNKVTDNMIMSAKDQAELERLIGINSEDMPTSMAVNQGTLNSANSVNVAATAPRSKYYGVYNNNGDNQTDKAFRAAVRLGSKTRARWVNLGYYNCEHIAAIAYNVAAINYFGKGAWVNPVATEKCDPIEHARYKEKRADYIADSVTKLKAMHANGEHPNTVDLERTQAAA